jgi:hypothetical protein
MGKLLVRLRQNSIHLIVRSIGALREFRLTAPLGQNLSLQAEVYLSFAGTSRQMKDLNFSVLSVTLWCICARIRTWAF